LSESPSALPHLGPLRKSVYALGDATVNMALSSMTLVYASYFLVQVADLRPALAGLVPLVGRAVDAFTDPLMGEISDRTRWRSGRRRPWFLIGAIPFGLSFALLWVDLPAHSQLGLFTYYTAVYCLMSVAMTMVSVPYLAIQPEMALDYDERTSINTYRTVGSLLGTVAAVNIRAVADAFGGGSAGFVWAGATYGFLVAIPWLAVHRATFERPDFQRRAVQATVRASLRAVFAHKTFTRLTTIYIMGRIAMDLAATLIILYTTYWLGRSQDFELVMMLFLGATVAALPFWLAMARGRDKSRIFLLGSAWWMTWSVALAFIRPEWPAWILYVFVPFVGFGYAIVDLMPWSMVGEVIDEDELHNGERREGSYNGVFTFLRKLGGAIGVFLAMSVLDLAGYEKGAVQTETARQAIRWMTALGPAFFLAIGIWLVRGYPLTRAVHERIVVQLTERNGRSDRVIATPPSEP
jgi:sugar (glycoside-pentoside-hexuronide) transporter